MAPYYNWINGLCRIFFATKQDDSPIPQMKREFMNAVLDSPAKQTSLQYSEPFNAKKRKIEEETITPIPEEYIKRSKIVAPNNSLGNKNPKKNNNSRIHRQSP